MLIRVKNHKQQLSRFIFYAAVLAAALVMKYHYSQAEVGQLKWILSPTATLVQLLTGIPFVFEQLCGYANWQQGMVIAKSCAGINFLIISFCMLTLSHISQIEKNRQRIYLIIGCALGAYLYTIMVNTLRIVAGLQLHLLNLSFGWLNPARIHRLCGILVYFLSLCLLHFTLLRFTKSRVSSWRLYLPLICYLSVVIVIPLGLMTFMGWRTGFGEHLLTALVVSPLIFWGFKRVKLGRNA
jgi:exosortase K